MKKLLLTSDGFSNPEIIDEFLKLADKPASGIKVILIPTASSRTEKELMHVKESRDELIEIGIREKNIRTLDLNRKISYNEVAGFDVIFVCGGNAFYLLHKVRENEFDKIVRQFLENGGIYVGVSAGSYIACPTIEMAAWKHADRNDIGLKDLTALNLIPFLITAHFEPKWKNAVEDGVKRSKYPVKILADNQAILVINNEVRLIDRN